MKERDVYSICLSGCLGLLTGDWLCCSLSFSMGVFSADTNIGRPWKMYPLGILFGLGFDTSSEVALLGIASIQAAKGTSIWLILIFPVLFTGDPLPSPSPEIPPSINNPDKLITLCTGQKRECVSSTPSTAP